MIIMLDGIDGKIDETIPQLPSVCDNNPVLFTFFMNGSNIKIQKQLNVCFNILQGGYMISRSIRDWSIVGRVFMLHLSSQLLFSKYQMHAQLHKAYDQG